MKRTLRTFRSADGERDITIFFVKTTFHNLQLMLFDTLVVDREIYVEFETNHKVSRL